MANFIRKNQYTRSLQQYGDYMPLIHGEPTKYGCKHVPACDLYRDQT